MVDDPHMVCVTFSQSSSPWLHFLRPSTFTLISTRASFFLCSVLFLSSSKYEICWVNVPHELQFTSSRLCALPHDVGENIKIMFIYVSGIHHVIGARTDPPGPAMAHSQLKLRHNFAFNVCVILFPDWTAVVKSGRLHKCARIRLTFSMAKLPYLPGEPHQPVSFTFQKRKHLARRR